MSLKKIEEKIICDAEAQAQKIREQSDKKISEIKEKTKQEMNRITKEYEVEIERTQTEIKRKSLSGAHNEVKLKKEKAKENILKDVLKSAQENLESIDDASYKEILTKYLAEISQDSEGVFVVPANRAKETKEIISDYGFKKNPTKESDKLAGGLIFEGKDIYFDFSFKTLLENKYEENLIELGNILFRDL